MATLSVKNLFQYQHYHLKTLKNGAPFVPSWCKLYTSFWSDYGMRQLEFPTRMLFLGLISLAAEFRNAIPADPSYLTERLGFKVTRAMIQSLLDAERVTLEGNLPAIVALPVKPKIVNPVPDRFDEVWPLYPRKVAKAEARKAWAKLNPQNGLVETIIEAITKAKDSPDWTRDEGKYIPHFATWLNGKRWEDEQASGLNPAEYLRGL